MLSKFGRSYENILIIVTVVAIASSCGKKKKDDDEDGAPPLTGAAAVVGAWSGVFSAIDEDGKLEGDTRGVEVSFVSDGKFTLTLKDDSTAYASGTWEEFQGKNIFLTVRNSTISRIQAVASIQQTSYDLTGNSMYVKGEAFELKISRKMVETPSGQGSSSGGYAGRWSCVEGGIKTELSISEGYGWRGIVTDSDGRAGVLEGSGRVEEDSLLLTVISSSDPVVPGATLRLTLTTDGAKLGLFSNEDLSGRSLGTCTK